MSGGTLFGRWFKWKDREIRGYFGFILFIVFRRYQARWKELYWGAADWIEKEISSFIIKIRKIQPQEPHLEKNYPKQKNRDQLLYPQFQEIHLKSWIRLQRAIHFWNGWTKAINNNKI